MEIFNAFFVTSKNDVSLKDKLRPGFQKAFQRFELLDIMTHDFDHLVTPLAEHQKHHVCVAKR